MVVHHRFCVRNIIHHRDKIHWHLGIIHLDIGIGTYQRGECGAVHVHEAVHLTAFITHRYRFVVSLDIRHRDRTVFEVHRKVTVHIFACLGFVQEFHLYTAVA